MAWPFVNILGQHVGISLTQEEQWIGSFAGHAGCTKDCVIDVPVNIVWSGSRHCPSKTERKKKKEVQNLIALHCGRPTFLQRQRKANLFLVRSISVIVPLEGMISTAYHWITGSCQCFMHKCIYTCTHTFAWLCLGTWLETFLPCSSSPPHPLT